MSCDSRSVVSVRRTSAGSAGPQPNKLGYFIIMPPAGGTEHSGQSSGAAPRSSPVIPLLKTADIQAEQQPYVGPPSASGGSPGSLYSSADSSSWLPSASSYGSPRYGHHFVYCTPHLICHLVFRLSQVAPIGRFVRLAVAALNASSNAEITKLSR